MNLSYCTSLTSCKADHHLLLYYDWHCDLNDKINVGCSQEIAGVSWMCLVYVVHRRNVIEVNCHGLFGDSWEKPTSAMPVGTRKMPSWCAWRSFGKVSARSWCLFGESLAQQSLFAVWALLTLLDPVWARHWTDNPFQCTGLWVAGQLPQSMKCVWLGECKW